MTSSHHFFLDKSDPDTWKALNGVALKVRAAADAAGLSRGLVELLNVRISQLNRCAFCLDMHTRLAVEAGITQQQLALLPAWQETTLFGELERAVLAVGEAATTLPEDEVRLEVLAGARSALTDEQFSAVQWIAVTMNAFNRVSVLSGHPVRPRP